MLCYVMLCYCYGAMLCHAVYVCLICYRLGHLSPWNTMVSMMVCTLLCCDMLCNAVLCGCYAVLCNAVLLLWCYAMPCCVCLPDMLQARSPVAVEYYGVDDAEHREAAPYDREDVDHETKQRLRLLRNNHLPQGGGGYIILRWRDSIRLRLLLPKGGSHDSQVEGFTSKMKTTKRNSDSAPLRPHATGGRGGSQESHMVRWRD